MTEPNDKGKSQTSSVHICPDLQIARFAHLQICCPQGNVAENYGTQEKHSHEYLTDNR